MTSSTWIFVVGAVLGLAMCQTQTSQTINLDGNDQLKLRIVFQPEQQQQSPCSTGNCGQQQQTIQQSPCSTGNCGQQQQVVQQSPCSTGNCGQQQQQVQQSPCSSGNCQASTSSCSTGNCGQQQQQVSSPCSTGNCPSYDSTTTTTQTPVTINTNNFKVIRIPSYSSGCSSGGCRWFRPRCPGCQRRRFFMPPPPRFFSSSSSSSGSIGIPDTVYANGRAYAAPIRIPTSYSDGNPVFGRSG